MGAGVASPVELETMEKLEKVKNLCSSISTTENSQLKQVLDSIVQELNGFKSSNNYAVLAAEAISSTLRSHCDDLAKAKVLAHELYVFLLHNVLNKILAKWSNEESLNEIEENIFQSISIIVDRLVLYADEHDVPLLESWLTNQIFIEHVQICLTKTTTDRKFLSDARVINLGTLIEALARFARKMHRTAPENSLILSYAINCVCSQYYIDTFNTLDITRWKQPFMLSVEGILTILTCTVSDEKCISIYIEDTSIFDSINAILNEKCIYDQVSIQSNNAQSRLIDAATEFLYKTVHEKTLRGIMKSKNTIETILRIPDAKRANINANIYFIVTNLMKDMNDEDIRQLREPGRVIAIYISLLNKIMADPEKRHGGLSVYSPMSALK
ncbi:unnamed protein product, partial [Didymodactylos carnosus]